MAGKRCAWYELVQLAILLFAFSLMMSKHYIVFENIFSIFYESQFSIVAVGTGGFSIFHGLIMMFKGFMSKRSGGEINLRELIESIIVIACGVILLSPEFNTIFHIPLLTFMEHIPDDVISHLAFGLVPIMLLYLIDMIRFDRTD